MANKNTIVRAPHDRNNEYFSCARATPQDRELTWEARGVLWYLLSKPGDWEVQIDDLRQHCGRDKVYKILEELREAKYMKREKWQNPKTKRWEWGSYLVYERPYDTLPSNVTPFPEKPDTALPDTEIPDTANQEINTQSREETELENDSVPSGTGEAPQPEKKPRKPIKRSEIFKTLARESFQVFDVDAITDKETVILINKLERWLKDNSSGATDQTLMAFYRWYDQTIKVSRPRDVKKFATNFNAFKQQKLAEAAKKNTPEWHELQAREQRNRAKAEELRRAMEGVA